jgi:hypothetical protein
MFVKDPSVIEVVTEKLSQADLDAMADKENVIDGGAPADCSDDDDDDATPDAAGGDAQAAAAKKKKKKKKKKAKSAGIDTKNVTLCIA